MEFKKEYGTRGGTRQAGPGSLGKALSVTPTSPEKSKGSGLRAWLGGALLPWAGSMLSVGKQLSAFIELRPLDACLRISTSLAMG